MNNSRARTLAPFERMPKMTSAQTGMESLLCTVLTPLFLAVAAVGDFERDSGGPVFRARRICMLRTKKLRRQSIWMLRLYT